MSIGHILWILHNSRKLKIRFLTAANIFKNLWKGFKMIITHKQFHYAPMTLGSGITLLTACSYFPSPILWCNSLSIVFFLFWNWFFPRKVGCLWCLDAGCVRETNGKYVNLYSRSNRKFKQSPPERNKIHYLSTSAASDDNK